MFTWRTMPFCVPSLAFAAGAQQLGGKGSGGWRAVGMDWPLSQENGTGGLAWHGTSRKPWQSPAEWCVPCKRRSVGTMPAQLRAVSGDGETPLQWEAPHWADLMGFRLCGRRCLAAAAGSTYPESTVLALLVPQLSAFFNCYRVGPALEGFTAHARVVALRHCVESW